MIESGVIEFPVKCACGGKNRMYEDFLRGEYVIVCECGTKLTVDAREWTELFMEESKHAGRR